MTTFSYTLELDDGERSTLSTALAMLKDDCLEQMETTPGAPYKARLRNIERIEKKLDAGARQTSGHVFHAGFEQSAINNPADYKAALKIVSTLVDADPKRGTPGADRLEVLGTLLEAYEAQHFPKSPGTI